MFIISTSPIIASLPCEILSGNISTKLQQTRRPDPIFDVCVTSVALLRETATQIGIYGGIILFLWRTEKDTEISKSFRLNLNRIPLMSRTFNEWDKPLSSTFTSVPQRDLSYSDHKMGSFSIWCRLSRWNLHLNGTPPSVVCPTWSLFVFTLLRSGRWQGWINEHIENGAPMLSHVHWQSTYIITLTNYLFPLSSHLHLELGNSGSMPGKDL